MSESLVKVLRTASFGHHFRHARQQLFFQISTLPCASSKQRQVEFVEQVNYYCCDCTKLEFLVRRIDTPIHQQPVCTTTNSDHPATDVHNAQPSWATTQTQRSALLPSPHMFTCHRQGYALRRCAPQLWTVLTMIQSEGQSTDAVQSERLECVVASDSAVHSTPRSCYRSAARAEYH